MTICRLCGNEAGNISYRTREMMLGFGDEFDYFKCARCGCLQITVVPDDMSKYYPAGYYSYRAPVHSPLDFVKYRIISHRDRYALSGTGFFGGLMHRLKPAIPILGNLRRAGAGTGSRILDVGCGNGETINYLGNIGFRHLTGVDPFATRDIVYDNGARVYRKTIHELDGTFDLIMFNNSFEHIPDPKETMVSVRRLLSPGGVCMIMIPTVASYAWEQYGVNWVNLDAPRHFFLYTPDNLRKLAGDAGLALLEVEYDSCEFQFWGSEQYVRGIALHAPNSYLNDPKNSIFSAEQIEYYRRKARELNALKQGDSIAVYLKNPSGQSP